MQEVITLTKELVDSQSRSTFNTEPDDSDADDDDDDDDKVGHSSAVTAAAGSSSAAADAEAARAWLAGSDVTSWKPGDKCRAIWSDNHQYVLYMSL